jgi:FtsP/CotA-like multicopper oxidase with cupredoxin domain
MSYLRTMVFRSTLFSVALTASLSSGEATELLAPLTLLDTGVIDAPPLGSGCALPSPGPLRKSLLFVRDTVRPDVGPYNVTLPGYATTSGDAAHDTYRPYLIRANPGDTLRIDLVNELGVVTTQNGVETADNVINLHTHGLVVSPRPNLPCDLPGDYIFNQLVPSDKFQYRIDIPKTVLGIGGVGRQPFPSGLFWFHSHLHGYSKSHVQAGQSGIIAIDPAPVSSSDATDIDPTSRIREATDERFLVLRDIQLGVPPGQTPDKPSAKGQTAFWIHDDDYDTQACRAASNPTIAITSGEGFCSHPGWTKDGATDNSADLAWLFTINGQLYPTVTVAPGRTQLWRVANVSATVAFTLNLFDGTSEQEMHVLSLDGVVAGTPDPGEAKKLHPSVSVKRLLLMPASRAEILVENTNLGEEDKILVLRTDGIETGGIQPTASRETYMGDPWPKVDLASVVLKGRGPAAELRLLMEANTFERSSSTQLAPEALGNASVRVPDNCITLPSRDLRRRITFDQDNTLFKLGSEVVMPDGTSVDNVGAAGAHTIAPRPFQHAIPSQSDRHICIKLGDQEVWELVNITNELHNFHIHQTKFRLARHGDPGVPTGFQDKDATVDPANVVESQVPEFGATSGIDKVDVWHDTLPVPPAQFDSLGNLVAPGRAFVTIPFKDPVQVGTFVFHCHILEHEDKGMMATVEVFDPAHPGASRQGADARFPGGLKRSVGFCGTPPSDFVSPVDLRHGSTWLDPVIYRASRFLRRTF